MDMQERDSAKKEHTKDQVWICWEIEIQDCEWDRKLKISDPKTLSKRPTNPSRESFKRYEALISFGTPVLALVLKIGGATRGPFTYRKVPNVRCLGGPLPTTISC